MGEVTRAADGTVTARGLPAPALDDVGINFARAWAAHPKAAQVEISEVMLDGTGMRPHKVPVTVTFVPGDVLYWPAMMKTFAESQGLTSSGLSSAKFVIYDETRESPEDADDRGTKRSNFRKGTGAELFVHGDEWIYVHLPVDEPTPDVLRRSSSRPELALPRWHMDSGHIVARVTFSRTGEPRIEPMLAGEQFTQRFARDEPSIELTLLQKDGSRLAVVVPKEDPRALEAHLVHTIEQFNCYIVTPAVDPAIFLPPAP